MTYGNYLIIIHCSNDDSYFCQKDCDNFSTYIHVSNLYSLTMSVSEVSSANCCYLSS